MADKHKEFESHAQQKPLWFENFLVILYLEEGDSDSEWHACKK